MNFPRKIHKKLQTSYHCKNALGNPKNVSDTALESLDIILFNTIIFGYHSGTHGTQKYTYVKHTKLNRLERGHFELFGIRQQVLTKSIIMKMSASQSSFRKYLTSEQYMSFLKLFWQRSLY